MQWRVVPPLGMLGTVDEWICTNVQNEYSFAMPAIKIVRSKDAARRAKKSPLPPSLEGKTVRYKLGSGDSALEVVGVVRKQEGGTVDVIAAIPNHAGVLYTSKDATPFRLSTDAVEIVDMECRTGRDVKAFETRDPLDGVKAASELKQDGITIDYRGVTFDGYGSTFQSVTPRDRDGDYVLEGAFDHTLRQFRENPVMLTDHTRNVAHLMGHYDKVGITERGLALRGIVTDSPHPDAVHVRFQLMEKSLKTLSIGGFFFYLDDYRGIEEVDLHETSLVVIPANPDANFIVRAITEEVVVKAFRRHMLLNGGELRLKAA